MSEAKCSVCVVKETQRRSEFSQADVSNGGNVTSALLAHISKTVFKPQKYPVKIPKENLFRIYKIQSPIRAANHHHRATSLISCQLCKSSCSRVSKFNGTHEFLYTSFSECYESIWSQFKRIEDKSTTVWHSGPSANLPHWECSSVIFLPIF